MCGGWWWWNSVDMWCSPGEGWCDHRLGSNLTLIWGENRNKLIAECMEKWFAFLFVNIRLNLMFIWSVLYQFTLIPMKVCIRWVHWGLKSIKVGRIVGLWGDGWVWLLGNLALFRKWLIFGQKQCKCDLDY